MAVNLSPIGNDAPFVDSSGNPLSGGLLYTYTAGSVTAENTYTTSAGSVANANPIVLNANGYPASGGNVVSIWLTAGVSYLFVLKTSAGVTVWSRDNIDGINDTSVTIDQWVAGPTPTFISTTSFSLVGDQTSTFHVGRRLKTTNSGGTVYSTITASAFTSLTTVTVANDSGTLDSGLSAVSYSLVSATNTSINADMTGRKGTAVASAATTNIWGIAGDFVHITGSTGPITSLGTAPFAGAERILIFDSTPTITHNATTLQCPGGVDIVAAAGDRAVVRADTTANMIITSYFRAATGAYVTAASESATGVIELATQAEVNAMTDTTRALTANHNKIVLGTAQATTSGTTIDFTGIPAGVRRITINFIGVGTGGTSNFLVQLGDAGGIEDTTYVSVSIRVDSTAAAEATSTAGFAIAYPSAADLLHGTMTLNLQDAADFRWVSHHACAQTGGANNRSVTGAGYKALSAELTQLRITTVSADTFDTGEVNISYER